MKMGNIKQGGIMQAEKKCSEHLIDPEVRGILDVMGSMSMSQESYMMIREQMATTSNSDITEKYDVELEEIYVDNLFDESKVRLIVIKPKNTTAEKHPLLYSIHGGGMVIGNAEMDNEFHAFLAHNYNFIGVSVDYRLAPEHTQPAQLHDCYSGIKWCIDNAVDLNIDTDKIALSGVSAGAGLAGGLALYIRDLKEFDIHHLRLLIPMLDDRTASEEPTPYNGEFAWTNESNYFGWKSVLNQEPGSEGISPYYSPARADLLAGLPSTYLCVGAIELFTEETLDFSKRLIREGVPTELHVYPGYHHLAVGVPDAYHSKRESENNLNALLRALKVE